MRARTRHMPCRSFAHPRSGPCLSRPVAEACAVSAAFPIPAFPAHQVVQRFAAPGPILINVQIFVVDARREIVVVFKDNSSDHYASANVIQQQ